LSETTAPPRAATVLAADEAPAATRWEQPAMEGGGALLTARQLESLQKHAFEEAHAAGYAAGKSEARAHVERFGALMRTFARPLEDLDASVEEALVALAVSIARQIIRRELRADSGEIVAVVREALALLPVGVREVRVHLHPDDARVVRALAEDDGRSGFGGSGFSRDSSSPEQMWRIVEDPALERGGCRVESESSQIDARIETRIGAVVSRLLGGERSEDERA
jgi:flagellar assembly protein FliH